MIRDPKVGDLVRIASFQTKERGIIIEVIDREDGIKEVVYDQKANIYIDTTVCRVMWDELPESFIMVSESENKKVTKVGNYLLKRVEE